MISQSNPTIFRPKSNIIGLGIFFFFLAGINISTWYTSALRNSIALGCISAALIILGYLGFAKPKVIFFDEGLTIVNPTESYTLSWKDVEGIDSKYTMRIQIRDKTIGAWAAPGPSRRQAKRVVRYDKVGRMDLKAVGIDPSFPIRPGDLAESDSGLAAGMARIRLIEYSRMKEPITFESLHTVNFRALIYAAVFGAVGATMIVLK